VIWIDQASLDPFLMQRLTRIHAAASECPLLKKKSRRTICATCTTRRKRWRSQDIALECTFRMINAETQLLYSSDYPHWNFDLPRPSTTCRCVGEGKHNILGGTAARLFKLPPRNEAQKENLKKFGNLQRRA